MSATARSCPSCATSLPADAVFCHRCGARTPQEIDRATGEMVGGAMAPDRDQEMRLQAALGDTCEVRRLLGRGGFAEVYVAYDKRLKREIAVKTLRGDVVASPTLLERFQREAEAVAKLRHPNVVPIYTVGEGNGLAYYTMPIIEGETLAETLEREGRLSVAEAARILRDAAHALQAAHRAGVVHRDVKPENIMLEGPEHAVVVMDFGIAATTDSGDRALTGTGMLVGTPQYMSPEQAAGDKTLDHRSDQYSLAMVGYRMLTGQLPFQGESVQTILFKTITEAPPPPRTLAADIPAELSDTIIRALAKDPVNRFASMADFASAVGAVAEGDRGVQVVAARRRPRDMPTRAREARSRIPGRTGLFVAGAGVALAIAVGFIVASTPHAVISLASEREDAVFAARALVNSAGTPQRRKAYAEMVGSDSVLRFMRKSLSFREADARAGKDIPVWEWRVALASPDSADSWQVGVGPRGRINGYRHRIGDSVPGARTTADSARRLAERELVARGWALPTLVQVSDSVIQRVARTDHLIRWRTDSGSIVSGKDTARLEPRITITGDRVSAYSARLNAPQAGQASQALLGGVIVVAFVLSLVLGVAVAIKRSRIDELQWMMMIRLLIVVGLAMAGGSIANLLQTAGGGDLSSTAATNSLGQQISSMVIGAALLGVAVLCAGAIGESLAQAHRPHTVAGLDDLSRGRVVVPEVVPAVIIGVAGGAAALLIEGGLRWAALRFGWRTEMSPQEAFSTTPVLERIAAIAGALLGALTLLFSVFLLASWKWTSRVALVLPGLLLALVPLLAGQRGGATVANNILTITVIALALWQGGIIAAFVAVLIWMLVEPTILSLWAGGPYLVPGMVGLLLIAAPIAAAVAAHRRFFATASPGA